MATSRSASARFGRYLQSTKNLVGSAAGLVGLGLWGFGLTGDLLGPLVVGGLYAAGALAAPPATVSLGVDDARAEVTALRADLDELLTRLHGYSGRLPVGAAQRLDVVGERLRAVLDRPDLLTGMPDQLHAVHRTIHSDLPTSFESYLNLPRWFGSGRGRPAGAELLAQLDLIAAGVTRTAEQVFAVEAQRMTDHTRYLADRDRPSSLDGEPSPESAPPA